MYGMGGQLTPQVEEDIRQRAYGQIIYAIKRCTMQEEIEKCRRERDYKPGNEFNGFTRSGNGREMITGLVQGDIETFRETLIHEFLSQEPAFPRNENEAHFLNCIRITQQKRI